MRLWYSAPRQPGRLTTSMRATLITALLVHVIVASPASAQRQKRPELIQLVGDLKHYQGMVAAYREGNDDVVAELLGWDQARLESAVRAINSVLDPNRPWSPEFLRSGALLQTAAMLQCLETGADDRMLVHFGLAADQLRQGSTALAPFAAKYYYAISRLFRSLNSIQTAESVLDVARRAIPSDPLILYDSGTIEELYATGWYSEPPRSARSARDTEPLRWIIKKRSEHLAHAHDLLQQSVAGTRDALARLHFGRVLMMQLSDREALEILTSVVRDTADRATKYLALSFIGGVHERAGRAADAISAYRAAVDCFPQGQAAYVALSELLQASGQVDDARAVLRELLKPGVERHEPLSWYFLEPRFVARERIDAIFADGRR